MLKIKWNLGAFEQDQKLHEILVSPNNEEEFSSLIWLSQNQK